ncbi:MAG: sugar kinase [Erysipelotrichaceae bacterium]|nr:sugar kinase [Erysipelotrichaceae bacterium]
MTKIVCLGETLLRYATARGHRFKDLAFTLCVGGCETNVAVSLSQFNFDTVLVTKLPNHGLGDGIMSFLSSYGVNTDHIVRTSDRIGSYYLEMGSGNRPSSVIYDRSYSAMTTFSLDDVDLDELFKDANYFMTSGITAALGETVKNALIKMMKYCRDKGITVVYDVNYRAKMWSQEACGQALKEIIPYVDILSAGILDAENFLGLKSYYESYEDQLECYYKQIMTLYPNIKYITSTKRDIISSSVNDLTGYLYDGHLYHSDTYHIDDIIDRVGGGDAYMAGILYGLCTYEDVQNTVSFATAAAVLKHSIYGDANQVSVNEVEAFIANGTNRIQR